MCHFPVWPFEEFEFERVWHPCPTGLRYGAWLWILQYPWWASGAWIRAVVSVETHCHCCWIDPELTLSPSDILTCHSRIKHRCIFKLDDWRFLTQNAPWSRSYCLTFTFLCTQSCTLDFFFFYWRSRCFLKQLFILCTEDSTRRFYVHPIHRSVHPKIAFSTLLLCLNKKKKKKK